MTWRLKDPIPSFMQPAPAPRDKLCRRILTRWPVHGSATGLLPVSHRSATIQQSLLPWLCVVVSGFPHADAGQQTGRMVNGVLRQNEMKWNESGFRPLLCTYRLNWARRTSWGWWDDWDDTVLQTQDSKFEPWRSEAEHATSRSRRLPTILTFTRGWGRNNFVSFKPPRPGTEPRTLAWKAAVLTTTLGPPPRVLRQSANSPRPRSSLQSAPGQITIKRADPVYYQSNCPLMTMRTHLKPSSYVHSTVIDTRCVDIVHDALINCVYVDNLIIDVGHGNLLVWLFHRKVCVHDSIRIQRAYHKCQMVFEFPSKHEISV